MNKSPKVGIGVIVRKDNQILLGKRKNSHGDGCWAFPGGHLEYGIIHGTILSFLASLVVGYGVYYFVKKLAK